MQCTLWKKVKKNRKEKNWKIETESERHIIKRLWKKDKRTESMKERQMKVEKERLKHAQKVNKSMGQWKQVKPRFKKKIRWFNFVSIS